MSCQLEDLRIIRSQLLHFKLETKLARKYKVFFIYITILNNKEIFENSQIKTKSSIANTCRNFISFQLLSIAILFRFKTIIKFLSISTIRNAILNCVT